MALISALLSRLLADEFKAWSPRIVHYIIGRAVAQLPEGQRARYEEEWESHINEIPGEFGKLFTAVGFLIAARRMTPINGERAEIGAIAKRTTDVIGSALVLFIQAPLFFLIGLAIRLTSKTQIIVTERRVGLRGREFDMLKFGGAGRVQRFLERTSLNYLPQFVNVLRADMAFIGPRADMPHQAEAISAVIPNWRERTLVRPGMVSFTEANAKGILPSSELPNETIQRKLEHDLYYIKNRSLKLDILVLCRSLVGEVWRPRDY